jgi:hypothetical protein
MQAGFYFRESLKVGFDFRKSTQVKNFNFRESVRVGSYFSESAKVGFNLNESVWYDFKYIYTHWTPKL